MTTARLESVPGSRLPPTDVGLRIAYVKPSNISAGFSLGRIGLECSGRESVVRGPSELLPYQISSSLLSLYSFTSAFHACVV